MEQLLKITTIPIQIEFKVNNARFERQSATADVEISRNKGGLTIKSQPIKLNIDTFEARNSVVPTTARSIAQNAQAGMSAAYQATAQFVNEGQMLLNAKIGEDAIGQIIQNRMANNNQYVLGFAPSSPAEITATPMDFTIEYEMDKLNFEWKTNRGDFQFIPGNIEFTLKQRPSVVIEYIGGPIYVPPSADPDYVPLDIKA